jgi:hypothetical protein
MHLHILQVNDLERHLESRLLVNPTQRTGKGDMKVEFAGRPRKPVAPNPCASAGVLCLLLVAERARRACPQVPKISENSAQNRRDLLRTPGIHRRRTLFQCTP